MVDDKPEQALAEAREAVALTPNIVRAHISLGRALAKTGHPEEAGTNFGKLLRWQMRTARFIRCRSKPQTTN